MIPARPPIPNLKPDTTDVMIHCIAENAVYDDNGAELNAYDVAKAVYEPVKDNEKTEGQNSVCHMCSYVYIMMLRCSLYRNCHMKFHTKLAPCIVVTLVMKW